MGDQPQSAIPTILQSIANTTPAVSMTPADPQMPARAKETGSVSVAETAAIQEVASGDSAIEQEPIPAEVEAWMQKVGQTAESPKLEQLPQVQVTAPVLAPKVPSKTMFVLPLGEAEVKQGLHASINDSVKWLATWCQKVLKQLKGQATYGSTK